MDQTLTIALIALCSALVEVVKHLVLRFTNKKQSNGTAGDILEAERHALISTRQMQILQITTDTNEKVNTLVSSLKDTDHFCPIGKGDMVRLKLAQRFSSLDDIVNEIQHKENK